MVIARKITGKCGTGEAYVGGGGWQSLPPTASPRGTGLADAGLGWARSTDEIW